MDRPKQLLDWHGVPLVQYQVRQLEETSAGEIVVVLGHEAERIRPLVAEAQDSRVRVVVNEEFRQGKTTSIKAGLRALRGAPDVVMLLAIDQPRPAAILQRLVEGHREGGNLISVPSHRGQHGHPPVFSGRSCPSSWRSPRRAGGFSRSSSATEASCGRWRSRRRSS